MRTIVDIPDDQIRALDEICAREGISRAEAVRRAVMRYVHDQTDVDAEDAFGLWRGRAIDPLAHEDELRGPRDPATATSSKSHRRRGP